MMQTVKAGPCGRRDHRTEGGGFSSVSITVIDTAATSGALWRTSGRDIAGPPD